MLCPKYKVEVKHGDCEECISGERCLFVCRELFVCGYPHDDKEPFFAPPLHWIKSRYLSIDLEDPNWRQKLSQ